MKNAKKLNKSAPGTMSKKVLILPPGHRRNQLSYQEQPLFRIRKRLLSNSIQKIAHSTQLKIYEGSLSSMIDHKKLNKNDSNKAVPYSSFYIVKSKIKLKKCESFSSSDTETEELIKSLSHLILDSILFHFAFIITEPIINESIKDMISAMLLIFSTSILDHYVRNFLDGLVDEIVKSAVQEIKDAVFFDLSEKLIYNESLVLATNIIKDVCEDTILTEILNAYADELELAPLVKEALDEENWSNKAVFFIITEEFIECLLKEDWVEMLIEDEISSARLSKNYQLLPLKLQKEIAAISLDEKADEIIEEVYFDILNDYVANIWIENLVRDYIYDKEFQDEEDLMPVCPLVRNSKKKISLFLPGVAYKFTSSYK